MKTRNLIALGLILTLLLIVAVGGLYYFAEKKMVRDSLNQYAAAKSLYERAQWDEAGRLFADIVSKYPRSDVVTDSLYYAAMVSQAANRYEEALARWQELARLDGDSHLAEIAYYSGLSMENLGRSDQAAAQYTQVAGMYEAGEFASLAKTGLGRIAEATGNIEEARTRYEEALALAGGPESRGVAEKMLGDLNLREFLKPREDENKKAYIVRPGDSMVGIAINHNTTVDLISRINNIDDPTKIRPNKRILIPTPDFSVLIDKSEFKLTLFNHDKYFKAYKVGLGKHGCTPVGQFVIGDKIKNPTWWSDKGPVPPGDPRNELGTRWMALKPLTPGVGTDYGIHGTIDPSTIGWESSNGCPRMYPSEAEEFYMFVTNGTPVEIVQ